MASNNSTCSTEFNISTVSSILSSTTRSGSSSSSSKALTAKEADDINYALAVQKMYIKKKLEKSLLQQEGKAKRRLLEMMRCNQEAREELAEMQKEITKIVENRKQAKALMGLHDNLSKVSATIGKYKSILGEFTALQEKLISWFPADKMGTNDPEDLASHIEMHSKLLAELQEKILGVLPACTVVSETESELLNTIDELPRMMKQVKALIENTNFMTVRAKQLLASRNE